jgi:hypothetical protein
MMEYQCNLKPGDPRSWPAVYRSAFAEFSADWRNILSGLPGRSRCQINASRLRDEWRRFCCETCVVKALTGSKRAMSRKARS